MDNSKNHRPPLLELKEVRKWFHLRRGLLSGLAGQADQVVRAVDGVSLRLQHGEILGVVGESGSGKSTLGEMIVGLEEPTAGEIFFDGTDVRSLLSKSSKSFRQQVQIIFQDPYATLNPRFTIYRTMVEPLLINGIRDRQECERRVRQALIQAGLKGDDSLLQAYPHQLSGGQRQRISIGRAIVLDPKLLVADEPVSMLDVSIRSGILNLLEELRQNLGLSIIFISHDLSTVQYLCDRVAIMYLGRIMEIGPVERVIGNAYHPYSRALLNAVPLIDPETRRSRIDVTGELPDALQLPPGCRFASRCPFVTPECTEVEPELVEISHDHWVRCIHPRFEPLWNDC